MDRRQFLARTGKTLGGIAALGAGGNLLAACASGTSSKTTSSGAAKNGNLTYQLVWLPNFQNAGDFVADSKGYFAKEGLQVTIKNGGPGVIVEPLLVSGKAQIAAAGPQDTLQAISKGADLKIIGALYQKSVWAVISLASKPIHSPADLMGKKIGISAGDTVAWQTFLKINGIGKGKIDAVPVQYDTTPLVAGEVDAWLGYVNNEVVTLESTGHPTAHFMLSDFGYKTVENIRTVSTAALNDPKRRAQLVAFMKADVHGWQDAVANPAEGAALATNVYGKSLKLDLAQQTKSAQASNQLIQSDTTHAHGLMWMSPQEVEDTLHTLGLGGVTGSASSFTNEILQEVYQGANRV